MVNKDRHEDTASDGETPKSCQPFRIGTQASGRKADQLYSLKIEVVARPRYGARMMRGNVMELHKLRETSLPFGVNGNSRHNPNQG
jgi:hypothetical protein